MRYLQARQTDGRVIEFESTSLNQGGEKTVFMSRDRSHVVAFYHGQLKDRLERVDRLTRILTRYNPTQGEKGAYWTPYFCWPSGMIDRDGVPADFAKSHSLAWPALGVVAPVYRPNFFFRDRFGNKQEKEVKWFTGAKASKLVPDGEKGTLLTRLQVCVRLARAVRRMHFAGLAHSDLSNKNVLIDPKAGDACVIDIDSLVVPGVAPPTVLGTPGYIAPEVLAGKAQPSIDTDKHALAVLLYQILLGRHPLQGKKVHSMHSAEHDEALAMGARALYVEHPLDKSNPPAQPITVPAERLGPHLAPLFMRAFVNALHHPTKRPHAAEWESALYRTLQLVHPSPTNRDWTILAPGLPLDAPFTRERLLRPVPWARFMREMDGTLADEKTGLALWHNLVLHDWHLRIGALPDEGADRRPKGYASFHGGTWFLVNGSGSAWQVRNGGSVAHGQSVELAHGLELRTGERDDARVLRIEFL
nr:hypothetical protein [Gemmatimonadaceae bacterium]